MKVFVEEGRQLRLIGRAEIPETDEPVLEVLLFGAQTTIAEHYALEDVAQRQPCGRPGIERAVILSYKQRPELLPGWTPLASEQGTN